MISISRKLVGFFKCILQSVLNAEKQINSEFLVITALFGQEQALRLRSQLTFHINFLLRKNFIPNF